MLLEEFDHHAAAGDGFERVTDSCAAHLIFLVYNRLMEPAWFYDWRDSARTGETGGSTTLLPGSAPAPARLRRRTQQPALLPLSRPGPDLGTEAPVRLPRGICFAPMEDAPPVKPLPALHSGTITFGSLHRLSKLNDFVIDLWSQVLNALPAARLLVCRDTLRGETQAAFLRRFTARGIGGDRLDLRHDFGPLGHRAVYEEIDMCLDTFPYGGGTTLCEALWMGVPVLTLRGDRPPGRVGASLLSCLGLTEWIAETRAQYLARAVEFTGDLECLSSLRAELRRRMRETVCDGKAFTRNLEEAYRAMWRGWCARFG